LASANSNAADQHGERVNVPQKVFRGIDKLTVKRERRRAAPW
jgi:hypothetical protein